MKKGLSYKSKRTIVITSVIVALFAASATGVYMFTKGNNRSSAYTDANEQAGNYVEGEAPIDNQNGQPTNNPVNNETNNQGEGQPALPGEEGTGTENNENGESTGNIGNAGNQGTTNPGTPTQEYTQTTTVITEQEWYNKQIGWTPLQLSGVTAVGLGINKPELESEKTAYVMYENEKRTIAYEGEEITYEISVTNNGNTNVENIRIEDVVPEGTTLTPNSITNNGQYNENTNKITWKVNIGKGETVTVSFKATVNENNTFDSIKNTAKVNGTNTETTETPLVTTYTVNKVWDDANNQDGFRPENVKVQLLANGEEEGNEITLNEANNWTYTWVDLPLNENDQKINYTVKELNISDKYTSTINGNTITNKHVPEEVSATVTKVWDDANNQDGIRPEELTVTLSNGTTATLNEANGWTATVENLPKYAAGEEIEYTWTEGTMPEGYSLKSSDANGTVTTITNYHKPEETESTVVKVWNDNNNQDGIRPDEIVMTLSNGTTATLNEENGWTVTITNLPKYKEGKLIGYTWTEANVPAGYTITNVDSNRTTITITNTHTPEVTTATVAKVWNDGNDQDGIRPDELVVTLSNGTEVTLNEENGWTATVENLPKYAAGVEIEYTWTEGTVEGYTASNPIKDGVTTTLTNNHTPEVTTATVAKVWNDGNDQDGIRPDELVVTLSNGTEVTLNEANGWTATVENLPKYAAGVEIEYTWTEGTVEGYTASAPVVNGTTTTLTNNHTPEVTTATVAKVWNDNNDEDGIRPDELVVTLSNGTEVTLNEENEWTATVENLPKYAAGEEIEYTWTEGELPEGYEMVSNVTENNVTTITNKHEVEKKVNLTVNKKVLTSIDESQTVEPAKLDVILVLDTSLSMNESMTGAKDRADAMVKAANHAMTEIFKQQGENISNENRVGIVSFGNNGSTLLPLDHYTPKSEGEYLIYTQKNWRNKS